MKLTDYLSLCLVCVQCMVLVYRVSPQTKGDLGFQTTDLFRGFKRFQIKNKPPLKFNYTFCQPIYTSLKMSLEPKSLKRSCQYNWKGKDSLNYNVCLFFMFSLCIFYITYIFGEEGNYYHITYIYLHFEKYKVDTMWSIPWSKISFLFYGFHLIFNLMFCRYRRGYMQYVESNQQE